MSQEPSGQDWWQASDGLWYPPETHPDARPRPWPAAPPYGTPPARQPQQYGAPPQQYGAPQRPYAPQPYAPQPYPPVPAGAPSGAGRGCLVSLLIVLVVVGGLGLAVVAGVYALGRIAERTFDRAVGGLECTMLTDAQATEVLGESEVLGLGGIASVAVPALDTRVLPDADTCWVTATSGRLARVARAGGGAAAYDAEREKARSGEVQEGESTTVDPEGGYFADDLRGLGDEAFCTGLDLSGAAGVLVRDGETLVYASVTPDLAGAPEAGAPIGDETAADNCADAQQLARAVLSN